MPLKKNRSPQCDDTKCLGWKVFSTYGSSFYEEGKPTILKCSPCNRFKGDHEAQTHALRYHLKSLPASTVLYNRYGKVCTVSQYRKNPSKYKPHLKEKD